MQKDLVKIRQSYAEVWNSMTDIVVVILKMLATYIQYTGQYQHLGHTCNNSLFIGNFLVCKFTLIVTVQYEILQVNTQYRGLDRVYWIRWKNTLKKKGEGWYIRSREYRQFREYTFFPARSKGCSLLKPHYIGVGNALLWKPLQVLTTYEYWVFWVVQW